MVILSIDPAYAKPYAYAIFHDQELVATGQVSRLKALPPGRLDYVITEDPYPRGEIKAYSYKGNVVTFKKLCFAVGKIQLFAELKKAKVILVRPVDWKGFYEVDRRTSAELQEQYRSQLTGIEGPADVQDAVLIGMYGRDVVLMLR